MGFLDWTEKNPALTQGLLAAAFGAMSGRGTRMQALGQGGLTGLLGYSNAQRGMADAEKEKEAAKMRQMQMGMLESQMSQQQAQAAQRAKDQEAFRNAFAPTSGPQAMAGGGGPTMANAEKVGQVPQFDPRSMFGMGASPEAVIQAAQFNDSLTPKRKLRDVSPGAVVIDEGTGKEVFRAPEKTPDMPSAVREYQFAQGQGYKGSFNDFVMSQKRAGAANVNVPINMGQKGFDNTLKLRGDFRSEPIYKAHQDVKSAHAQIKAAIQKESPAGDLAAATKIMKILDPGSVVRESELGMAMAATGVFDRMINYANMLKTGQKLTPAQRKDFGELADSLYGESSNAYNAKRSEYEGIAQRNELNTADVLGPADEVKPAGGWSAKKVQ